MHGTRGKIKTLSWSMERNGMHTHEGMEKKDSIDAIFFSCFFLVLVVQYRQKQNFRYGIWYWYIILFFWIV